MAVQVNTVELAPHVFNMMVYPEQHPNNQAWVQQQLYNPNVLLNQAGQEHFERLRQLHERMNNAAQLNYARSIVRNMQSSFMTNAIVPIFSPLGIDNAAPIMQRFIMACTELRNEYHKGRMDWYPDSYVDEEPSKVGFDHYDYRIAVTGMVQDDGSYFIDAGELKPGDRDLTFQEKSDISVTWDYVKECVTRSYVPSFLK